MFKKGDKVLSKGTNSIVPKGIEGVVLEDSTGTSVPVEWNTPIQNGHDCASSTNPGKEGYCWWMGLGEIELYEKKATIKTLNKDTVKVGQKVKVIAQDANEIGFNYCSNNAEHTLKKGYIGIITKTTTDTTNASENHTWVYVDGHGGIGTMLLELLEEPKSESKEEILVFGKFKIGDIVVSLTNHSALPRYEGQFFKVMQKSDKTTLYYGSSISSSTEKDWRLATPEECRAFESGITNIKDMKKEEKLTGRYLKCIKKNSFDFRINPGDCVAITSEIDCNYIQTNFGAMVATRFMEKGEFELMPVGFTPELKVKEDSKDSDLIAEAKRRFPIGTKFFPAHLNRDSSGRDYCIVTNHDNIKELGGSIYACTDEGKTYDFDSKYGNTSYDRILCEISEEKWAEIIEESTEEFKVGDWVTCKIGNPQGYKFTETTLNVEIPKPVKNIAIRVTSEEETAKVLEFSKNHNYPFKEISYSEPCITLENGCYGGKDWYLKNNYTVISFQEYQRDYLKEYTSGKRTFEDENFEKVHYLTPDDSYYKNKKVKSVFNEEEFLSTDYNKVLNLPIVKKHKKKSIINL